MPQETIVCLPDISEQVSVDGNVTIDFLLPNGVFVQLPVDFHKPLDLLKQALWESVRKYPLFNKLKGRENYFFEYLNKNGEREEVQDESLRLSQVRPIGKFLRLLEKQEDEKVQTVDRQIMGLLGHKISMEMQALPMSEMEDFQKKMAQFIERVSPARRDIQTMMDIKHPLQLRSNDKIPEEILQKTRNGYFVLHAKFKDDQEKFVVQAHIQDCAQDVVDNALQKKYNQPIRRTSDYILKVLGQEEFLYGKTPLHKFKYVYNRLLRSIAPEFWVVNRRSVITANPDAGPQRPPHRAPRKTIIQPDNSSSPHHDLLVWDIENNFSLTIMAIDGIEVASDQVRDNIDKVKLFVGLYHGNEVLADVKCSSEMPVQGGNCNMCITLNFDLPVMDVQPASRLCFTLHGRMKGSKGGNCNMCIALNFDLPIMDVQPASRLCFTLHGRMKGAKGINPIAWVNIPVFDFRSRLLVGEHRLVMWPVTTELRLEETGCYPLGTVSLNPHGTITLTVKFSDYNRNPPIVFPSDDLVTQCAADNMEDPGTKGSAVDWTPDQKLYENLQKILDSRSITESLCEQDKDNIWLMRYECRESHPYALPLVLKSVKWNNHIDVAKMQVLLSTWHKKIPVDSAMELLDFNFPDNKVRKYAVDCLQDLTDDELSLYLLQLVQALKYENYLYCPLAEFLMERALRNEHIGQQLVWLLKSELHNSMVKVRYGLLMEAYLKANHDHLKVIFRQFEALGKLHAASELVKAEKYNPKDEKGMSDAKANLRTVLSQQTYKDRLSNITSPLSPLYKLSSISVENCKFFDSKKRPLFLVWTDEEEEHESCIIYKNGDDLRQDMLTLQMLQVMDSIWQKEGLDLRMNVYECVATGDEQGMIEVVKNATTLAKIQTKSAWDKKTLFEWLKMNVYGCVATGDEQGMIEVVKNATTLAKIQTKSTWDRKTLFEWLKDKNREDKALDDAIEEFIRSCAAYTVATYVLGIGDRHNDNIMLKENGQLFHIDFGHFLGNFKSKYGVKRERVSVVLTSHFQYIITKGDAKKENWKRFEDYCFEAYLALRRQGTLLIRLFMMMLSSGIPQLSTSSDLDYLKEKLAFGRQDSEAIKQLKSEMHEALKAWSVKFNWMFHNMVH